MNDSKIFIFSNFIVIHKFIIDYPECMKNKRKLFRSLCFNEIIFTMFKL